MGIASSAVGTDLAVLFDEGSIGSQEDRLLLDRFAAGRGRAAELAFAVLVARHGPMVRGVCRRVLGDPHAADDAAQATFLALARKAGSIRSRDSLASWLFGVARRVAVRARLGEARRRRYERQGAPTDGPPVEDPRRETSWEELYQELDRLPASHRAPLVLCYLEGLTNEQAADRLRCPVRTVQRRLAQGRERLRARLARRGFAPTIGLLGAPLDVSAPAPAAWAASTVSLAMRYAARGDSAVPATVAALAEGAVHASRLAGFGNAAAILAAITLVAGTVAVEARWPSRSSERLSRAQVARPATYRTALTKPTAAAGYVLMSEPMRYRPLRPFTDENSSSYLGGGSFETEPVIVDVEDVNGGHLNISLLHLTPPPGLPEPDFRPVLFDPQGRRFPASRGPSARATGAGGVGFSWRRFRLDRDQLSAERRAFIAVERRRTGSPPSAPPRAPDRDAPLIIPLQPSPPERGTPRAEPDADATWTWAIEPRRVGRGGWAAPVAGEGVIGDVVKTNYGAIHVRMAFVTRDPMSSQYRPVVIDNRGRRHLLHAASSHGGASFPMSMDAGALRLTSRCNHIAPDSGGGDFLPESARDYPWAHDVAAIGIERLERGD